LNKNQEQEVNKGLREGGIVVFAHHAIQGFH
jgi:hypothetical protein